MSPFLNSVRAIVSPRVLRVGVVVLLTACSTDSLLQAPDPDLVTPQTDRKSVV